jgi:hypothetical protein
MIKIRDFQEGDLNFVSSSFYHSFRQGAEDQEFSIDLDRYNKTFNALFSWLTKNATIKVATSKDYPDLLLGFVIYQEISPNRVKIWYIYTKQSVRKEGLAKLLLTFTDDYEFVNFSIKTLQFNKIVKKCRNDQLSEWSKNLHNKLRYEV